MSDNGIHPPKKVSKLCLQLLFRIISSNGNFDSKMLRRQSWIRNQILKVSLKDHLFTDTLLTPHLALDLDHKFTAEAPLNLKTHTHCYYEVQFPHICSELVSFPLLCKHSGAIKLHLYPAVCKSQNISLPDYTILLLAIDSTGVLFTLVTKSMLYGITI